MTVIDRIWTEHARGPCCASFADAQGGGQVGATQALPGHEAQHLTVAGSQRAPCLGQQGVVGDDLGGVGIIDGIESAEVGDQHLLGRRR